jgi:uncharacterized integral membrane protein
MQRFNMIVVAVLAGIVLLFVLQNLAQVEVNFLIWTFEASRALVIAVSTLVGLVIGLITAYAFLHRHSDRPAER